MKMQLLLNLMEMLTLLLTKQKQRTFHFVIKSPLKAAFIKMNKPRHLVLSTFCV